MLNSFNSYKTSKKSAAVMMDYTSLEAATGKFSESSVLGVGGFGCVYKANFDGGFAAAVKRLGNETQSCQKEFEVMIIDCLLEIVHLNFCVCIVVINWVVLLKIIVILFLLLMELAE
jgi:hypothetical protein